jgi:RND family efflux transporter MFP subunit
MTNSRWQVLAAVMAIVMTACGGAKDKAPTGPMAVPIGTAEARVRTVERTESTVGRLEAPSVPTVAAETSGRVLKVLRDVGATVAAGDTLAVLDDSTQRFAVETAHASIERLEALLVNQKLTVQRYEDLASQQSVSQSLLDDARSQRRALDAQLREARARLGDAELALEKTRILSPAAGTVQRRLISVGDFLSVGDPAFEMVSPQLLQAFLPFPERLTDALETGQRVRLKIPSRPDRGAAGVITEIRPKVGTGNRAIEAIVNLENPGGWRAGASVNATVVLAERQSVVVPAIGVVRRPAGEVVYVVQGDLVRQQVVETGITSKDDVEILSGLAGGETIAADGAGFLTDGAHVSVRGPAPGGAT